MNFILEHIEFIISLIVVPTITWLFSKRHFQQRELENKDINVIRGHLNLYNSMIEDISNRSKSTISTLEQEIVELRKEIVILKKQLSEL